MLQIRFQYQTSFEICWSPSPATGKAIHSYIKDANNFIDKVNYFSVPVNSVLVTMEVRSLYTSIPNSEGITAAKKRYENYIPKTLPTKFIDKRIRFFSYAILTISLCYGPCLKTAERFYEWTESKTSLCKFWL